MSLGPIITRPMGAPTEVTSLRIEWPMTLPSMSNARLHWAVKAKKVKAQRLSTGLALRANGVGWRLKRLVPGEVAPRQLDDDNLRGALKAPRDEIAAFFHIDDADPRIEWAYGQVKSSRPRESMVRVEFEIEGATR
jgi:hypothetical protein